MPPAVRTFIEATNNGDSDAFVNASTPDACLNDWGREFHGRDGVRSWNTRQHRRTGALHVEGRGEAGRGHLRGDADREASPYAVPFPARIALAGPAPAREQPSWVTVTRTPAACVEVPRARAITARRGWA
ncbi:nuclear transport factor 2 family protein [Streptomyces sp. NPDC001658]